MCAWVCDLAIYADFYQATKCTLKTFRVRFQVDMIINLHDIVCVCVCVCVCVYARAREHEVTGF